MTLIRTSSTVTHHRRPWLARRLGRGPALALATAAMVWVGGHATRAEAAPPTTVVTTAAFSVDTGSRNDDLITLFASQTISGSLSAGLQTGEFVEVSLDNGNSWTAANGSTGATTWSLPGVTLVASDTLVARVANADGSSTPYSRPYAFDTTAPAITISGMAFSSDTGASSSDLVTRTAAQTVTASLSGAPASDDRVYGSLDNGASWTDITGKVLGTTLAWNGVTLAGSGTLMLKVTDLAGNDGTVASRAYVLDTTAPAAPTVDALLTPSLTPTLTGTAALAGGETMTVAVGGAQYVVTPVAGHWSLDLATAVPAGGTLTLVLRNTYDVVATVTDLAGNASTDASSNELSLAAGPAAPVIAGAVPGDGQVTLSWSVPDDNGSPIAGYQVSASPAGACSTSTATSCTVSGLVNGTAYQFTVRATNAVGTGAASAPVDATPVRTQATGTVPGMNGAASVTITGGGTSCTLVSAGFDSNVPAGAPAGATQPVGVFRFRTTGCPGDTLSVALTYPQPLPANLRFLKYGPPAAGQAPAWFELQGAAVSLSGDRRTVAYTVADDQAGDSDTSVPGAIDDPFAPMLVPANPTPVPTLSPWALVLTGLLAGLLALRMRRQAR